MTKADHALADRLIEKLLCDHRGEQNARRCQDLARDLGTRYNKIRKLVFYLITERGYAIGTSLSGDVRGYYIIETTEEAQHALAIPRARATENWTYHHALARAVQQSLNVEVEQLRLGV